MYGNLTCNEAQGTYIDLYLGTAVNRACGRNSLLGAS